MPTVVGITLAGGLGALVRYALDLTRNAAAFISAMRRLAAQNLAEERPSRLVEILFHSHPPTAARVDAARAWESAHRT